MFNLFIVLKEDQFTNDVRNTPMFNHNDYVIISMLGIMLVITLIFSAFVGYSIAHYIIRPLRMLNEKMMNIL